MFRTGSDNKPRYGILNTQGKMIIPDSMTNVFTTTSNGVTEYYVTWQGNVMRAKDRIELELKSGNSGTTQIQ